MDLPLEIIEHILQYVDRKTVFEYAKTNKNARIHIKKNFKYIEKKWLTYKSIDIKFDNLENFKKHKLIKKLKIDETNIFNTYYFNEICINLNIKGKFYIHDDDCYLNEQINVKINYNDSYNVYLTTYFSSYKINGKYICKIYSKNMFHDGLCNFYIIEYLNNKRVNKSVVYSNNYKYNYNYDMYIYDYDNQSNISKISEIKFENNINIENIFDIFSKNFNLNIPYISIINYKYYIDNHIIEYKYIFGEKYRMFMRYEKKEDYYQLKIYKNFNISLKKNKNMKILNKIEIEDNIYYLDKDKNIIYQCDIHGKIYEQYYYSKIYYNMKDIFNAPDLFW